MRAMKLLVCCGMIGAAACNLDIAPEVAGANPSGCRAIATAAPSNVTIGVGQSVNIAMTIEQGCPAPLVRNDTPAIVQVDSVSLGFARATGRAPGAGRLIIRSGVDTLVSTTVSITVTP